MKLVSRDPIQFNAGAAIDTRLPIQGSVVGVLGDDHLSKEAILSSFSWSENSRAGQ
jgi:hypothetical protein